LECSKRTISPISNFIPLTPKGELIYIINKLIKVTEE